MRLTKYKQLNKNTYTRKVLWLERVITCRNSILRMYLRRLTNK